MNWLTSSGAVTALVIGSIILLGTGLAGGALLTLFFVTGSLLTFGRSRPSQSGGRTAMQVTANSAWAAVGATVVALGSTVGWPIMIGSLAAAQADTWATEIGGRSRRGPRLITTGQTVTPGTSGGVTWLGSSGGAFGAALMGLAAMLLGQPWPVGVAGVFGGVAGMLADSLAGATHRAKAKLESAESQLSNDVVNVIGSGVGALVAGLLTFLSTGFVR
jgi:uncharacterized protein (TIGR00297 family)